MVVPQPVGVQHDAGDVDVIGEVAEEALAVGIGPEDSRPPPLGLPHAARVCSMEEAALTDVCSGGPRGIEART